MQKAPGFSGGLFVRPAVAESPVFLDTGWNLWRACSQKVRDKTLSGVYNEHVVFYAA